MIALCKEKGIWHEDESITPKVGDICFYDWGDSGKGDNRGWPDHVGIVENVGSSTFTVIEGNYSKAVKRRVMKINGRHLRGFARPKYVAASKAAPDKGEIVKQVQRIISTAPDGIFGKKSKAAWGSRVVKLGSNGEPVRLVQKMLIAKGYSVGECGADGECGKDTAAAIKRFQQDNGLTVDSKCGKETAARLFG